LETGYNPFDYEFDGDVEEHGLDPEKSYLIREVVETILWNKKFKND
jgi:hypothetical protein